MSKIKFENLKQLEKELQARLDLEHAEKERLMNLIHFYESVYHHLSTQVEFANLDKQRLIDAQKYAEKNTKSDIRSLYAILCIHLILNLLDFQSMSIKTH